MPFQPSLRAIALTGCALSVLAAPLAHAQVRREYRINAGDLNGALRQFSLQSDQEILFDSSLAVGKQTSGFIGSETAAGVLGRLLSNSGLTYRVTPSGTLLVQRQGQSAPQAPRLLAAAFQAPEGAVRMAPSAASNPPEQAVVEEIVVTGSQIQGSKITSALPVTLVDVAQIQATGATSGDDLLRTVPQLGNVTFNSSFNSGTSNSARGDVNSVALRSLGVSNTLVLISGRRTTTHPISQTELDGIPTFTYNSNAIPVSGIRSLEVLREGAAAIYGADAVAGVINTVLQTNYEGGQFEAQYGYAPGTNLREGRLTGLFGTNFQEGRGNLTVFGGAENRSALLASDNAYTDIPDGRILFAGTAFADATSLDTRSTNSPWGVFQTAQNVGTVTSGGRAVTGTSGIFRISPQANPTCGVSTAPGLCLNAGGQNVNTDRNLRFDSRSFKASQTPETKRYNLFATFKYDLTPGVEFFSELGYYVANSRQTGGSSSVAVGSTRITAPANSYYNPFGPVLLPNGQPNPNRLPGLSANVPAAGLPITINAYNLVDAGGTLVTVKNEQYRMLGGLKGRVQGFNWESAMLYSRARTSDTYNALSATKILKALSVTTPDAYNPFNGGTLSDPSFGDRTPSSAAALADLRTPSTRIGTTSLALWDLKINRPDMLSIWAGDVGVAAGIEVRRETYHDNRDRRVDGTETFTDTVSGVLNLSDIPGTSASFDVKGKRTVMSAFAELAIPLVSPEMSIPLVDRLELQLAVRAEDYSDVGSIAVPKVAGAWDIVPGVRLRGSWSEGFRAPNLELINSDIIFRQGALQDYIYCEADLRARRIANLNACSRSRTVRFRRAGNKDLRPETSTSTSYGLVLQPTFIPREYGRVTFTADSWNIKQVDMVGTFGQFNAMVLDYVLRVAGSSNPLVHRLPPTPEQIADFAGTGLAPVGDADFLEDQFINLFPQEASGIDLGFTYQLGTDRFGDFGLNLNAARLSKLFRVPAPAVQELLDARTAGKINSATPIVGAADLLNENGNVEWRGSVNLSWRYQDFGFTWFAAYTGPFNATDLTYPDGSFYRVEDKIIHSVTISYSVEGSDNNLLSGTRWLVGVRNLFDTEPPLFPGSRGQTLGYPGAVYNPNNRYIYMNIRKTF